LNLIKDFGEPQIHPTKHTNAFQKAVAWEDMFQMNLSLYCVKRDKRALCARSAHFMSTKSICEKELTAVLNVPIKYKIHCELHLFCWFISFTLDAQFSSIFENEKNQIFQFWWKFFQTIFRYFPLVFHLVLNGLTFCKQFSPLSIL